ncbi:MAG: hypothetical protein R3301_18390 [Saprospiraceae bacterium]|nr:hypothetical protein [Saprospiraceae bacterium]
MKTTKRKIAFTIEKTSTGFSAYSDTYAVYTTGSHISELLTNAVEACNLFFEDQGIEIRPTNIELEIDLKQFFTYYRVINAKFLAERIGMNETLLSQYVQGHKKPSRKQTERILTGIREIGQELSEINLKYQS